MRVQKMMFWLSISAMLIENGRLVWDLSPILFGIGVLGLLGWTGYAHLLDTIDELCGDPKPDQADE